MKSHRERGIQEKHALLGKTREVWVSRNRCMKLIRNFDEDIAKVGCALLYA
jgi:hypothetical protein